MLETPATNRFYSARRLPLICALVVAAAATLLPIYASGSLEQWEATFVGGTPHTSLDAVLALLVLMPFETDFNRGSRISAAASFVFAGANRLVVWEWPQLVGVLPFVIVASEYFGLVQYLRCAMHTRREPKNRARWGRAITYSFGITLFAAGIFLLPVFLTQLGTQATERKQYREAIRCLSAALWLYPVDIPNSYLQRGRAYYLAGRYDQAIANFDTAIRISSSFVNAYLWRGSALLLENRHSRALADFSEAIRLDPAYAAAYEGRGRSYHDAGNYQAAVDDLNEAADLDPKLPIHRARGLSYFRLGQFDRAIADFYEAVKQRPDDAWSYYYRGLAYSAAGDRARASADFDAASLIANEATRKDSGDQKALEQLAWMLATSPDPGRRDGKKAVEYARTVAASSNWFDADSLDSLDSLATAYAEAGDFDAAVKWEQKAIELADEPQPRRHERLALFKSKQPFHEK